MRPERDCVAHGLAIFVAERLEPERAEQGRLRRVGIAGVDGRDDREAGPQRDLLQNLLGEGDADRHALDDLGEIAGGVVGRQQRELRPRGGRDRRHHALDHLAAERVDRHVDLLPRLDVGELRLLEIGVDIGGVQRHQRHQPRARLDEVADLGRLVADDAVERRDDAGEGKIALGLVERGHEFAALARRLVALGLQDVEIGLGAFERGGRRGGARPRRRTSVAAVRSRSAVACSSRCCEPKFVCASLSERSYSSEARSTSASAPRKLRLRRLDLRLGLGDDRGLRLDLAAEAGDGRVLGVDARLRRVDGVPIVAVVDQGEKVALMDDLVVDDRDLR